VGVGTVLDAETARQAILAGAEFVVGPTLSLGVIQMCRRYSKIVVPGAFTPTEILTAWESGADLVKLFPATAVGPKYIKDLKGPLPQIPIVPTGGVDVNNAGEFIKAGAAAVAAGTSLVDGKALAARDFGAITAMAQRFVSAVRQARQDAK
jgi:2-dehydro-3-deoxyphosphogluconate aldolase/(4S)-4-hydroxy-2-oxoglutarate aldolase